MTLVSHRIEAVYEYVEEPGSSGSLAHVGNATSATRLQDAIRLAEERAAIGQMMKPRERHDAIDRRIGKIDPLEARQDSASGIRKRDLRARKGRASGQSTNRTGTRRLFVAVNCIDVGRRGEERVILFDANSHT